MLEASSDGLNLFQNIDPKYSAKTTTGSGAGIIAAYIGVGTPPAGWLFCDGAALPALPALDELKQVLRDAGLPDTKLPDLRGEFIRGLDSGRGIDSGRKMGTFQDFAIHPHTHYVDAQNAGHSGSSLGKSDDQGPHQSFGTQGTAGSNVGQETRPRNIALNYIIKY